MALKHQKSNQIKSQTLQTLYFGRRDLKMSIGRGFCLFLVPSPEPAVVKEDVPDTACSTKEEIQVIRDHYGENWLQVITAKNEDMQASSASSREHDKTEDDIYLNESHANLSGSSQNRSRERSSESRNGIQDVDVAIARQKTNKVKDVEDDIEVLPEPGRNPQGLFF